MITQKEFSEFKSTMLHEIRNMIRSELLTLPEMRIKHILEVSEEDDKIVISFAKAKEEMDDMENMEEEALDRSKEEDDEDEEKDLEDSEEDSTEDMPKAYDDEDSEDDDKRKNFKTDIDKIAELFAQII